MKKIAILSALAALLMNVVFIYASRDISNFIEAKASLIRSVVLNLLLLLIEIFLFRSFRSENGNQKLTYSLLFKKGLFYTLLTCIGSFILSYCYLTLIYPEFVPLYAAALQEHITTTAGTESISESDVKRINLFASPHVISLTYINQLFWGCLFSLILSAVYRTKEVQ